MTDAAPAIFVALEQSDFAAAIRQSPWLYPAANVGHIVFLTLFAGAIAVMDVRLLGGLSATAPGPLLARTRNVALAALAGMAVTGSLMFSAEASHLALNPVFQLKAVLFAAGLIQCGDLPVLGPSPPVEHLCTRRIHAGTRQKSRALLSLVIWNRRVDRLRAQHCVFLARDTEKWAPGFRKRSRTNKKQMKVVRDVCKIVCRTRRNTLCPCPLPPLVSPENMPSIRAMPRHAFGAPPGDRHKYKSKDDDGHEGRQDHAFVDVAGHFLPHSSVSLASWDDSLQALRVTSS